MTVRKVQALYYEALIFLTGEVLEKSTRVLTDEERAILDTEFVGRNGEKRKIEVRLGWQC